MSKQKRPNPVTPNVPTPQDNPIGLFLDEVSNRIVRYLAAFEFLNSSKDSIAADTLSLRSLDDFAKKEQTTQVRKKGGTPQIGAKGVIDPNNLNFQEAIKLVQKDIREVIKFSFETEDYEKHANLKSLVTDGPEVLALKYGSISQAWDSLVDCKHKLIVPVKREFGIASWHISCTSEPERLIREVVALCFYYLGRDSLRQMLLDCFEQIRIPFSVDGALGYTTTAEAVAQALVDHMRQSSVNTLKAASFVAERMKFAFMPDAEGVSPGLLDLLHWVPKADDRLISRFNTGRLRENSTETELTFMTLLDWRRQIIHVSVHGDVISKVRQQLPIFERTEVLDFQYLADFAASVGLRFALDVVASVLRQARDNHNVDIADINGREWKLVAELRFAHLGMLKRSQWGLAWAAGSAIEQIGDENRRDMSKLNSWFAQSRIDGGRFRDDAERLVRNYVPVSNSPRYKIMRLSILNEFPDIVPLLDEAFTSRDLTIKEFKSWPALENLRNQPAWNAWIKDKTE